MIQTGRLYQSQLVVSALGTLALGKWLHAWHTTGVQLLHRRLGREETLHARAIANQSITQTAPPATLLDQCSSACIQLHKLKTPYPPKNFTVTSFYRNHPPHSPHHMSQVWRYWDHIIIILTLITYAQTVLNQTGFLNIPSQAKNTPFLPSLPSKGLHKTGRVS